MTSEWISYPRVSFRSRSAPQRWISSLSHARSLLQSVMRFSFTASCSTPSCIHRSRFDRNLICTRSISKKTFKKPPFFGKWKFYIKNQNGFLYIFEFDIVVFRTWFEFDIVVFRTWFLHFCEPNFALTRLGFFASRSAKIVFSHFWVCERRGVSKFGSRDMVTWCAKAPPHSRSLLS